MTIENLNLFDFRLYKKSSFSFSPLLNIVIGPNTSGKTNLLEAIFLLAAGKSFKAEYDREMISFGREFGRVKAEINNPINTNKYQLTNQPINQSTNNDERIELEVVITQGEVTGIKTPMKKFSVNGVGKRTLDFVGRLKAVLFWPEDLELVTDSPSIRRRYLDFVLTQADREYRRTLISYEKGLRQRNRLLEAIRNGKAKRNQLIFWDQLLIKNGDYITKKREEYIEFVNNFQLSNYPIIQFPKYQLVYDKSVISRMRLEQYSEEEVVAGMTLVGPHRDDIKFRIKNKESRIKNKEFRDLSSFGSRGEQRLAILWLKSGELSYMEKKTGEKPVLLLDDILSELDHEHRKIIFGICGNQQTIITTTDEHFIEKSLKKLKIIEL